MNILVIGNGFDLAHGLPTKYGDFLEFCKRAKRIYTFHEDASLSDYKSKNIDNWEMNDYIKTALSEAFEKRNCKKIPIEGITYCVEITTPNKALDELYEHIKENTWLDYFLQCHSFAGENWIDFEKEISNVVVSLDNARIGLYNGVSIENMKGNKEKKVLMDILKASKGSLREYYTDVDGIDQFADYLDSELEKLIRALEIYIAKFVGDITIKEKRYFIEKMNPDYVLSFNYSDTYEKVYDSKKKVKYNYIHGKADISNTIDSNNMVLGIDENLDKDRKNKEIEFIAFKKYYQRICKGTGSEYRNWIYKIRESAKYIEAKLRTEYPIQIPFDKFTNDARHNLYIYGHSLDVTDKDILRELILNDNIFTQVLYLNKKDLRSKIANLVLVIGPEELIRRTGGSTQTIKFVKIEEKEN